MSSSSHRKHRLSQKQDQEAVEAQGASEASRASMQDGRNNSIAKTQNVSSQEPNPPTPSPSNPFPFFHWSKSPPWLFRGDDTAAQGHLEPNTAQPTSNRGASSLSFHLLHRRHSLGQVEFATQSSPVKALYISQVFEEENQEATNTKPPFRFPLPSCIASMYGSIFLV